MRDIDLPEEFLEFVADRGSPALRERAEAVLRDAARVERNFWPTPPDTPYGVSFVVTAATPAAQSPPASSPSPP